MKDYAALFKQVTKERYNLDVNLGIIEDGLAHVRVGAARYYIPALRRSGSDLQSGLPRFAAALSKHTDPDDQDERPWRDQHAWYGETVERANLAGVHERGLR